jgi:hypothetical protein
MHDTSDLHQVESDLDVRQALVSNLLPLSATFPPSDNVAVLPTISVIMLKSLIFLYLAVASTMAFVPAANRRPGVSLSMALVSPPPPPVNHVVMDTTAATTTSSALTQGINKFMSESPSQLLALQERKVPTAEEIAAKKRNFAWWFWGGGFVAPFLATFYYFGFKFWEK